MSSSTQPSAPGSLNTPAPANARACQSRKTAPELSPTTAKRPRSDASVGSFRTLPPASSTFATVASVSVTAKQVDQAMGCCGANRGLTAAAGASPRNIWV